MSKTFLAVATLIGTMVGAGILALPYVVMKPGFLIGVIFLIVLCLFTLLIHLYIGEIALRTKTTHHLTGYTEKYLGKKAKIFMFLASAFGIYSALTAYILGEGESLSHIFFGNSNYLLPFGIAFWILLSIISYFGLEALENGEKIGVSIIIVLIIIMSINSWNRINAQNLSYINLKEAFTPFGVVLFSFLGFSAIPELKRILDKNKNKMKKSIIISSVLVFFIYLLFTIIVLGSQGRNTPQIATLALGKIFVILGMLTMFTAYLSLAIALRDTLRFDFKFSRKKAWFITTIVPILIFIPLTVFNSSSFTKILSIGGIVSGGFVGVIVLFLVKKAKQHSERNPEYSITYSNLLALIIIILLIIGTIFEIWITALFR